MKYIDPINIKGPGMDEQLAREVGALRAFNRLYTRQLGLLNARLDDSPFSLSEARILYEIAHRSGCTGADLARELNLDPAQVSRTLKRFGARKLVATRDDPAHGRNQLLSLTRAGRSAFAALDAATQKAIGDLLTTQTRLRRQRLLSAATAIVEVFTAREPPAVRLRGLRPGDLGLVTARQAMLYAQEYGWNQDYEALVAQILADFHKSFDPTRDDAWIAEMDGVMVGSIFLVHGDKPRTARLRLLYVEPDARGSGVGQRLVATCIDRARTLGYDRLDLWTNSVLTAARHIYERAGFRLKEEAPHHSFGKDLVGQTWSLDLRAAPTVTDRR